jgi:hypothetical protein
VSPGNQILNWLQIIPNLLDMENLRPRWRCPWFLSGLAFGLVISAVAINHGLQHPTTTLPRPVAVTTTP